MNDVEAMQCGVVYEMWYGKMTSCLADHWRGDEEERGGGEKGQKAEGMVLWCMLKMDMLR